MLQKFLVRLVFGTVVFLILLAGCAKADENDDKRKAFEELLDNIEFDLCTGLMNTALGSEERKQLERKANAKCKEYHALLKSSFFYESNECINGDDPKCADTKDSWDSCNKMHRCSLRIDGIWAGTKRRSIYRCVSAALKQRKEQKGQECARRREEKGYKPAPEPPAPTKPKTGFPTARAPTATVNKRAPTSTASNTGAPPKTVPAKAPPTWTTASNTGAPPKTVPAKDTPTIKLRTRPTPAKQASTAKTPAKPTPTKQTPAKPAPTQPTPARTAPPAMKPNWPQQRQDSKPRFQPPTQWTAPGSFGNTPTGHTGATRPIPPPKPSPAVTVTMDPRASARTVTFGGNAAPRAGGGYQKFGHSYTFS
ncbi:uncharacterized protein [Bemisia tabaci]|uniref:uncharacterized protein n=1 Tax=Bemisia tabaci TaxID=7038 RepID=UPI003B27F2D2